MSVRPCTRPRRRSLAVLACLLALGTAGCGESAAEVEPGPEVAGGAIGPDQSVSEDVKLLQVQLEHPADGVYQVGEDAALELTVSNTGPAPDTLVDVSGPDFAGVRLSGSGLPLAVPADGTVAIGGADGPSLTLVDLTRELRSSLSTPVTFTFAEAGTVTVDVVVAADRS